MRCDNSFSADLSSKNECPESVILIPFALGEPGWWGITEGEGGWIRPGDDGEWRASVFW